jgi:hypothetical protein
MVKYWVINQNDKIMVQCGNVDKLPSGGKEITKSVMEKIISGEPYNFYDSSFKRKTETKLISEGLVVDNRNKKYWDTITKQPMQITELDKEPLTTWTELDPGEHSEFTEWDETEKSWVKDDTKILKKVKKYKLSSIDIKTRSLILEGFKDNSGNRFGGSESDQLNLLDMINRLSLFPENFTYPVTIKNWDRQEISFDSFQKVKDLYQAFITRKDELLNSDTELDISVNEATTIEEVEAITDNRQSLFPVAE